MQAFDTLQPSNIPYIQIQLEVLRIYNQSSMAFALVWKLVLSHL